MGLAAAICLVALPGFAFVSARFNELVYQFGAAGGVPGLSIQYALYTAVSQLAGLVFAALVLTPGSLGLPALVTGEESNATAALKRSLALVRGGWWRVVVGVAALLAATYMLPLSITGLAAALTVEIPASTPGRLFDYTSPLPGVVWLLSELILWPLAGIGLTRLYLERVSRVSP
jgi:hypothetical protein